ncbi:hypothetical protein EWM64_g10363 [Hericium alpestre]|uniref:Reverse transcriptase domain-containing protein n=1 Tax=Hericium alpestre TaxID=135208 RepID=A0A4Y9ZJN1_9AGAM|nr:hypothetical protein EWM64_g10363 [Hericium alpestre]
MQKEFSVEYPPAKYAFVPPTDPAIERAIDKLKPYKAPSPDSIPNVLWKEMQPYGHPWKDSTTTILRKPGKPDYTKPGAWQPIALLNTIGKILSSVVADDLMSMAEHLDLLPPTHFGCRVGCSTTDVLHYITNYASDAMKKGKFACGLFLDIKGAFPSMNVDQLTHDMRCRGIPKQLTEWIECKLHGRHTVLTFDGFTSELFTLNCGRDQGCPASGPFFQFYDAGLLDIPKQNSSDDVVAFVDNTTFLTVGKTLAEAVRKAGNMLSHPNGTFAWANSHMCEFGTDKFRLVVFTRKQERYNKDRGTAICKGSKRGPKGSKGYRPIPRPSLVLDGLTIKPSTSHKVLGVHLDQEFRFKEQVAFALKKGQKWVDAFRHISKQSMGLSSKYGHQYFKAIPAAKMLYVSRLGSGEQ